MSNGINLTCSNLGLASNPQTENPSNDKIISKDTRASTTIAGGVFVGLITALVLGIIFGPLAAIIAFCVAGVSSSFVAAKEQRSEQNVTLRKIFSDTYNTQKKTDEIIDSMK